MVHAPARSALGSPERGAGSPNGLTEGFSCSVYGQTPPPHVRSAPPLPGEAWALRASNSNTYYIIYKLFTHAIVVRYCRQTMVRCKGICRGRLPVDPTVGVYKPVLSSLVTGGFGNRWICAMSAASLASGSACFVSVYFGRVYLTKIGILYYCIRRRMR